MAKRKATPTLQNGSPKENSTKPLLTKEILKDMISTIFINHISLELTEGSISKEVKKRASDCKRLFKELETKIHEIIDSPTFNLNETTNLFENIKSDPLIHQLKTKIDARKLQIFISESLKKIETEILNNYEICIKIDETNIIEISFNTYEQFRDLILEFFSEEIIKIQQELSESFSSKKHFETISPYTNELEKIIRELYKNLKEETIKNYDDFSRTFISQINSIRDNFTKSDKKTRNTEKSKLLEKFDNFLESLINKIKVSKGQELIDLSINIQLKIIPLTIEILEDEKKTYLSYLIFNAVKTLFTFQTREESDLEFTEKDLIIIDNLKREGKKNQEIANFLNDNHYFGIKLIKATDIEKCVLNETSEVRKKIETILEEDPSSDETPEQLDTTSSKETEKIFENIRNNIIEVYTQAIQNLQNISIEIVKARQELQNIKSSNSLKKIEIINILNNLLKDQIEVSEDISLEDLLKFKDYIQGELKELHKEKEEAQILFFEDINQNIPPSESTHIKVLNKLIEKIKLFQKIENELLTELIEIEENSQKNDEEKSALYENIKKLEEELELETEKLSKLLIFDE